MTQPLSEVRRPRMRLVLNGEPLAACRSVEIVSPRSLQAARFHVRASLSQINRVLGVGWVDQQTLDVAIDFGLLPLGAAEGELDWVRMLTGSADRLRIDQVSGIASLDGRDNSGRLIDLPLQEGFLNNTSSEIASALASRCTLQADVDSTARLVGQYYQIQHSKSALGGFSRHGNSWDLLAELADLEGYEMWVDGTTLHFKQPVTGTTDLYDVTYAPAGTPSGSPALSISDLSMDRAFGLSDPVQVKVSSWNSRQRRQVTATYPGTVAGDVRQFQVIRPNLVQDDAENLARNSYARLRAHERVITGRMAGDLTLMPQHRLRLSGTGTDWDQIYTIDRIEREMSLDHGFVQHVTARIDTDGEPADV